MYFCVKKITSILLLPSFMQHDEGLVWVWTSSDIFTFYLQRVAANFPQYANYLRLNGIPLMEYCVSVFCPCACRSNVSNQEYVVVSSCGNTRIGLATKVSFYGSLTSRNVSQNGTCLRKVMDSETLEDLHWRSRSLKWRFSAVVLHMPTYPIWTAFSSFKNKTFFILEYCRPFFFF